MKVLKYIVKLFFLLYMVVDLSMEKKASMNVIVALLIVIAINIFKERYFNSILTELISFAAIAAGVMLEPVFGILFCIPVFDLVFEKAYVWVITVIAASIYFLYADNSFILVMLCMCLCSAAAFVLRHLEEKEQKYRTILDEERRLRYELEQAKARLVNSSRETVYLAEIKERNRIAREIHDNVGHSIAGILMQLQASYKLYGKEDAKSKEILKKSIEGLSASLNVLRDTVYNIKPQETLGVEHIKNIIREFGFCPVEFTFSGNFSMVSAGHLEILYTNIKEALTNAYRHSQASKVEVAIDINDKYIRLYIKDNGIGCKNIKEGLGLSGMKERVWNAGGTISINKDNGFLIVCLIPRDGSGGSGVLEGSYSR